MRVHFGVQLVCLWALLAASIDARSGGQVSLQDDKVACEPTKCPTICPIGSGGYHYYFDIIDNCLRCICGKPKGPADCGEDSNPSLCDSVAIPEDCKKNLTVIQSCNFSCSPSGQLWWAASKANLEGVYTAIAAGANPTCHRNYTREYSLLEYYISFPNMTALHMAALGDRGSSGVALSAQLSIIKALINANASLDVTGGRDNATALYYATWAKSPDKALLLIEHNADVNIATHEGTTPLMSAAAMGKLSVAKALINANASLDVIGGPDNTTALGYAIRGNNSDIALLLIDHNADTSIAALKGMTPLMLAAWLGQLSEVKAHINANANLDVTGGVANATALYYAIRGNNSDIVKALINANASLDDTGGDDNATGLYYAIKDGSQEIALLLIEHNADVNIPSYGDESYGEEMTPLMMAATEGQLSVVKALIVANAIIDVTGGQATATALFYAIRADNEDIALFLIEHNANVNIQAYRDLFRDVGVTPLMTARSEDVAKALINANASLDVTGGYLNSTALHYAAYNDNQEVALVLLQSGADAMIPNGDGRTAAESAEHNNNYQLANIIESYVGKSSLSPSITSSKY